MDRDSLAALAGFFSDAPIVRGGVASLGEEAAHHARVRRLEVGDRVYVADGAGRQGAGVIAVLTKKQVDVAIGDVVDSPRGPAIHMLIPVADRDRMLWCAEKCSELGATSWCPVMWHRSRSVSPRGEGDAFRSRIRGRMQSALVQSHAPWLPDVAATESGLDGALASIPSEGTRIMLDVSGEPIARVQLAVPVTIVVGPEGGVEDEEMRVLHEARFRPVSLGANVLRFETAAIAALAIARSVLATSMGTMNG